MFQASITDFTAKQKPQTPFSKSGLAEFIMEYIIDSDVGITLRISLVFDGWSRRRRKSYNSLVIFWIHSPPDKPTEWTLRNMLVAFDRMKGRHTGSGVGKLLVEEIRRYGFEERLGWTTSDNVTVTVNDATVRYICKEFDPYSISLNPKERRGRCMEHTLHLAAHHFAQALQIPSIMKTNQDLRQLSKLFDELDLDIDDLGCIEADNDDADAIIDANRTDFEAGDAVGKIFAFIAQVRASDHATLFLAELCQKNDCPALELLTWVRTRWGSLYHCFKRLIQIRQAYDIFCCLADNNSDVPALDGGKKYAFYQMSNNEWNVVISTCTTELGQEKVATCHKVFPILERARCKWEQLLGDPEYLPVAPALQAGLHNMQKWYQSAVDSPIYFICHVRKLSYLNAVWKPEWVRKSRSAMEQEFPNFDALLASDDWMDTVLAAKEITSDIDATADPLKELDDYLDSKLIPRAACEDIITWWGHNQFAYPVLSRLARDYLAIQGSAAAAERSFSSGGITDTARRGCLGDELFGEMQLLKNAYQDGRISAQQETWLHVQGSRELTGSRTEPNRGNTEEPDGFQAREPTAKKIKRGVLVCLGPHHEWSGDGHDKLSAIGFPIWGIRDVWSGKWLGLWVVPNNRLKIVIAYLFLLLVHKLGGIPVQMTTDCGSELVMVYGFANALRETFASDLAVDILPAHRFLQSIHNITIERGWLRLRLDRGDNVKIFWDAGSNIYNESNETHSDLAKWLWSTLIQAELDSVQDAFNNHCVRKDRVKFPSGVSPNVAFSLYEHYAADNGLLPVDCSLIGKLMEDLGEEELIRFVSKEYEQKAKDVFRKIGSPKLTMKNVWNIFQDMLPHM
ncbi:hypothetical protein D9757_014839 [Collybiopsis confluens]|uniref:Transposase n=1 Tax=Collybiopsis confluens TaxID=2823264 RepID=A0A8H5CQR0_9AGAR|nr:hypothetical protein D9757_014839 [Collybiopsis confluens]